MMVWGLTHNSFFHPDSHLVGVRSRLGGALKPPLGLYVQDVEQVRMLGLAGEAEAEVDATYGAGAIVVKLVGGGGRMLGGSAFSA